MSLGGHPLAEAESGLGMGELVTGELEMGELEMGELEMGERAAFAL